MNEKKKMMEKHTVTIVKIHGIDALPELCIVSIQSVEYSIQVQLNLSATFWICSEIGFNRNDLPVINFCGIKEF